MSLNQEIIQLVLSLIEDDAVIIKDGMGKRHLLFDPGYAAENLLYTMMNVLITTEYISEPELDSLLREVIAVTTSGSDERTILIVDGLKQKPKVLWYL